MSGHADASLAPNRCLTMHKCICRHFPLGFGCYRLLGYSPAPKSAELSKKTFAAAQEPDCPSAITKFDVNGTMTFI